MSNKLQSILYLALSIFLLTRIYSLVIGAGLSGQLWAYVKAIVVILLAIFSILMFGIKFRMKD